MAVIEITTVGAKVSYQAATTIASTHPTSTWTEIVGVNEAPELDFTPDQLDASDITDLITSYVPGRIDPGGDLAFTLNHSEDAITAWEGLVTACEDPTTKRMWFKYEYPGATKSFYWAGWAQKLGNGGIQQNQVSTIPAHVVFDFAEGWTA